MPHTIEPATSGRAKCRGCDRKIEKDDLRFGERQPNIFGDGEMTLWFHPLCAAYKRPEPLLEALEDEPVADAVTLVEVARQSLEHRRLPRVDGASKAPTGRARCRHCREPIEKDSWRLGLVYFEEFRFSPSGYIHAACASEYLGTIDVLDRVRRFSPELDEQALDELREALA